MDCSLSLNDANYLSRIFTAPAQISTFLVLKSFKIFHDKKYFSFSVRSRWEVTLGVKTCFINCLEYMVDNSRLHFIRTLITTLLRGNFIWGLISVPPRLALGFSQGACSKLAEQNWSCLLNLYQYPIGNCHNCSHLIVKTSVMIFSCLALDLCNPSLVLISSYQPDSLNHQMLATVATNWAIFWYHNA